MIRSTSSRPTPTAILPMSLVVDFGALGTGSGTRRLWTILTSDNPEFMAAGDPDGDGADEVAVDFGGLGVLPLERRDLEPPDAG